MAIKELNYNVRRVENGKSVKLNKEKQKLEIENLFAHHFHKIIICIYSFFILRTSEFSFG